MTASLFGDLPAVPLLDLSRSTPCVYQLACGGPWLEGTVRETRSGYDLRDAGGRPVPPPVGRNDIHIRPVREGGS